MNAESMSGHEEVVGLQLRRNTGFIGDTVGGAGCASLLPWLRDSKMNKAAPTAFGELENNCV